MTMKKCIHCGAEVPEEAAFCPACGQSVTEEAQTSENQQVRPENEQAPKTDEYTCEAQAGPKNEGAQEPSAEAPAAAAPAQKKPPVWVWIVGALAVAAIVTAILITGKKDQTPPADAAQTGVTEQVGATEQTEEEPAAEGETQDFVSYTATEAQLTDEVLARVVASCGGKELNNRMLDFYYWQQYYTFANNYGTYLSYLMDTSKGLDEQAYSDTETWQQAFLSGAADMFHSITALNLEADAAGFELSEEDQAQLDAIAQSLDATADYYGMESGIAYLQASFGPKATVEDYVAFARDNLRASRYLEKLMDEMEFTDAEISDYYDQNADTYAENHVEKIDKPMVNVRHILVIPAEQNEDGTYTDEAWAEAEKKAQQLLDGWKAGEATEESFAALANENSEDPGSNTNGGLYEDVYPGQMVDTFDAWCFDEARQPGDTGIVKTDYGYHIMYFVSKGEEIFWFETAKGDLLSERAADLEDSLREKYPMELTLENAAIFDVQAEDRAAANAAAEEAAQSETASDETGDTQEASGEGTQEAANE